MKFPKDPETEDRIYDEILVDAREEEIAGCWVQHFHDLVQFPFHASVAGDRQMEGTFQSEVVVVGLHPQVPESPQQLWLLAHLPDHPHHFAVRPEDLHELERFEEVDENTRQALHDWCYWTQHMAGI